MKYFSCAMTEVQQEIVGIQSSCEGLITGPLQSPAMYQVSSHSGARMFGNSIRNHRC